MRAIRQEHFSGCAISCVAVILKTNYNNAVKNFEDGNQKAKFQGFSCAEIIKALGKKDHKYCLKYIKRRKNHNYPNNTIVYIQKNSKYPAGHYLCKTEKGWMDSWINFPRLNAKAGFRKKLPGKPVYAVIKI